MLAHGQYAEQKFRDVVFAIQADTLLSIHGSLRTHKCNPALDAEDNFPTSGHGQASERNRVTDVHQSFVATVATYLFVLHQIMFGAVSFLHGSED